MHEADGGIIGGGAAGGIEDVVESTRGQFGQFGGQHRRGLVAAVAERVVVLHPRRLPGDAFHHFAPAVADVHAPEPGHAVEQSVTSRIDHVHALGLADDLAALLLEGGEVGVGVDEVVSVHPPEGFPVGLSHALLRVGFSRAHNPRRRTRQTQHRPRAARTEVA